MIADASVGDGLLCCLCAVTDTAVERPLVGGASTCSTAAGRLNDGREELKLTSPEAELKPSGDNSGGIDDKPSVPAMSVNGVGESG